MLSRIAISGEIKQCLNDKETDINLLDQQGHTALFYAVQERENEIVNYLLAQKADPNKAGLNTFPPLVYAAAFNYKDSVSTLLNHPGTDVNACKEGNSTALFAAVQQGNEEIVDVLLAHGADLTICVTAMNTSPLHKAIGMGHERIMEKLVQKVPKMVNSDKILLENEGTPLRFAAEVGNIHAIEVLLRNGADVNAVFKNKITPLYMAAQNGHDKIVQKLLISGADYVKLGKVDSEGDLVIPLGVAVTQGHTECVELLLKYPHATESLITVLHYNTSAILRCRESEKRQSLHALSELVKKELLLKRPYPKILTLQEYQSFTWEQSFIQIFQQAPMENDKHPMNKDSAIRYALAAIFELLRKPESCVPYLQLLSQELKDQWRKERDGEDFPKFDINMIELWSHHGMLWPIPNDKYKGFKKCSLIERIIRDKFKQYGMGDNQSKWTGYLPKNKARRLLLDNALFTENRRTINGLFHGNVHNLQRVILLYAMEATTYNNKDMCNELMKIQFHIFGGLPEYAIQMDEKRSLEQVSKIEELQNDGRNWSIQRKHYAPLKEPVKNYGDCLKTTFFSTKNSDTTTNNGSVSEYTTPHVIM